MFIEVLLQRLTHLQKDYADNEDARKFDARLRGPVTEAELAIDPNTGNFDQVPCPNAFLIMARHEELHCK